MRQLLYTSDNLLDEDVRALDMLMAQARMNNGLDGITGLLWTDGARFAQVLEGDDEAIESLMTKISVDPRHSNVNVLADSQIQERRFGGWAMMRPEIELSAETHEQTMQHFLSRLQHGQKSIFAEIVAASRPAIPM